MRWKRKRNAQKTNKTFRKKLFLTLMSISFLFMSLITIIYCTYSWERGIVDAERYFVETAKSIKTQLDQTIGEMNIIACQVASSGDIQDILKEASGKDL